MDDILLKIIGFFATSSILLLCYFLKQILDEMKSMNAQLVSVVTNQGWHFSSIKELQQNEKELEERVRYLESSINKGREL